MARIDAGAAIDSPTQRTGTSSRCSSPRAPTPPGTPTDPAPVTVCLESGDTHVSDLARRHRGDRDRWPAQRSQGRRVRHPHRDQIIADCVRPPPR